MARSRLCLLRLVIFPMSGNNALETSDLQAGASLSETVMVGCSLPPCPMEENIA